MVIADLLAEIHRYPLEDLTKNAFLWLLFLFNVLVAVGTKSSQVRGAVVLQRAVDMLELRLDARAELCAAFVAPIMCFLEHSLSYAKGQVLILFLVKSRTAWRAEKRHTLSSKNQPYVSCYRSFVLLATAYTCSLRSRS